MTRAGYNTGWYWRRWRGEVEAARAALANEDSSNARSAMAAVDELDVAIQTEVDAVHQETRQLRFDLFGEVEPPSPDAAPRDAKG